MFRLEIRRTKSFRCWVNGVEEPMAVCPKCQHFPFQALMRGQVAKSAGPNLESLWCRLWKKPYARYAIICLECKEIVGYEVDKVLL